MATSKNYMELIANYGSDDEYNEDSSEKMEKSTNLNKKTDILNKNNQETTSKPFDSQSNYSKTNFGLTLAKSEESKRKYDETRRRHSPSERRQTDYKRKYRTSSRDRTRSTERRERQRSRSRSRERKYSRSSHTRSRSKDRINNKKYDKASNKMEHLKKLGIELPKYYNPAVVNPVQYAEQIQKRRLLWQKKEEPKETPTTKGRIWEATTFAQDKDGKQAEKFKRLMGIKDSSCTAGSSKDILKKQQEMFSSMEQQYEVARTATHTMRGVGLGFGNYQQSQ